ncbi:MAG: endonuclease III [Candidatus Pacebacteria bacterium]|nr:endonuclease III [Candidatus Paceibacterota bacterium]
MRQNSKQQKVQNERKKRVRKMISILKKLYPNPKMALDYGNDWELLVAVVLSAQCTDKRVNQVTKDLFKKYKKFDDYVRADIAEFEQDIRSTGFYKNKAKNILASSKIIKENFDGMLPKTMEEMLTLPGVARKTANILLSKIYGIDEGIAVDTHIRRFSIRFDLTDETDPKKIEKDLMEIVPKKDRFKGMHLLVKYGQEICPARKHDCKEHPLTKIYPHAASVWPASR